MKRRDFLRDVSALAVASPVLSSCSSDIHHEQLLRDLRSPMSDQPVGDGGYYSSLLRELVRYSTLAPSSHNTQCWQFQLQPKLVSIMPDLTRRCPVVDPDDHHLFISLGCAAENLVHAALANGLWAEPRFDSVGAGAIAISLEPTRAQSSSFAAAIPVRQSTRGDYDNRPLSNEELRLLELAGSSNHGGGIHLMLITEHRMAEKVLEYVVAGNTAQMNNAAFVKELKSWIRFSPQQADRTGDGLYAAASGNPAMPEWLGGQMMNWFFTLRSENERNIRQIRNSSGLAIFFSDVSDPEHWVEVGRCYQRFALQATALGIRNAMLNQPVEVGTIRPHFATALGLGNARPDLVVRFGRGSLLPYSIRRPVSAVLDRV
ncbi:hypothetical protein AAKU64_000631 [Undibacterium sp. GrIS 1.8]|uniref:Acg family FMN-binding oxidoreductase n=1 Tax=unclassified Undibacterium TaxID=2630295 RepID=UPI003397AE6D